jgi:atypical dual specificity phosphatase
MLDIESGSFSWDELSSLHHTEHSSSNEHSEDEMNKALEVHQFSTLVIYINFPCLMECFSMLRSK